MMIILDRVTRSLQYFPEALDLCERSLCPGKHAAGGRGQCVLGLADTEVVCLGSVEDPLGVMSCNCTQDCPHLQAGHPALLPLLERLADLVEPPEQRVERLRAATVAKVRGEPFAQAGRDLVARITRYAPEALAEVPLVKKEPT